VGLGADTIEVMWEAAERRRLKDMGIGTKAIDMLIDEYKKQSAEDGPYRTPSEIVKEVLMENEVHEKAETERCRIRSREETERARIAARKEWWKEYGSAAMGSFAVFGFIFVVSAAITGANLLWTWTEYRFRDEESRKEERRCRDAVVSAQNAFNVTCPYAGQTGKLEKVDEQHVRLHCSCGKDDKGDK